MRSKHLLSSLIYLVIGLAEFILAFRIVFRLFAANPNASFVNWIYTTSGTLLQPFRGIFPTTVIDKSYALDFNALFALIVYALVGSLLVYFVEVLERAVAPSGKSSSKN